MLDLCHQEEVVGCKRRGWPRKAWSVVVKDDLNAGLKADMTKTWQESCEKPCNIIANNQRKDNLNG